MQHRVALGLSAALALASFDARANWTGQSEVGYVMSRGNAETQTGNIKLDLVRENNGTKHNFGLLGLYGESEEVVSAQRWNTRWQTDWKIRDGFFWFGSVRYEDDRFSGFDYQSSASTGIGYTFIDSDTTILRTQIGGGYRLLRTETLIRDENNQVIDRIGGEKQRDGVINGALRFEHALNDSTKVLNSFLVESGEENTSVQNELALQVKMTEVLALSLGLSVRNNSNPPDDQKNTDTLTTVNLVYLHR